MKRGVVGGKVGRRTHAASVNSAVCLVTCSVVAHVYCTQRGVKEACTGWRYPSVLFCWDKGQGRDKGSLAARVLNILVFQEVPRHSHREMKRRVRRVA